MGWGGVWGVCGGVGRPQEHSAPSSVSARVWRGVGGGKVKICIKGCAELDRLALSQCTCCRGHTPRDLFDVSSKCTATDEADHPAPNPNVLLFLTSVTDLPPHPPHTPARLRDSFYVRNIPLLALQRWRQESYPSLSPSTLSGCCDRPPPQPPPPHLPLGHAPALQNPAVFLPCGRALQWVTHIHTCK